MSKAHARRLVGLLRTNETLRTKGFSLTCTPSGGIVIDRWGHVHGIWNCDGGGYTWVSPSSSEPIYRTGNPKSAVLYTVVALTKG